MVAIPSQSRSARRSASTTCPARRSASRSPASPPPRPRSPPSPRSLRTIASPLAGAFTREQAAARAGVTVDRLAELLALEFIKPRSADEFSVGDVRRARLVETLIEARLPIDALAEGFRRGLLTLDFVDG